MRYDVVTEWANAWLRQEPVSSDNDSGARQSVHTHTYVYIHIVYI